MDEMSNVNDTRKWAVQTLESVKSIIVPPARQNTTTLSVD
jgi:hypothetical protein